MTIGEFKKKAIELSKFRGTGEFQASKGWFDKYRLRWDVS